MNQTRKRPASSFAGSIERGPRGPILRDDAGVSWRIGFADGTVPENVDGQVRIRGRVVDIDRIEVDYIEVQNDA